MWILGHIWNQNQTRSVLTLTICFSLKDQHMFICLLNVFDSSNIWEYSAVYIYIYIFFLSDMLCDKFDNCSNSWNSYRNVK